MYINTSTQEKPAYVLYVHKLDSEIRWLNQVLA